MSGPAAPDFALNDALRAGDELPQGVRLRVAIDVLVELRDEGVTLEPRSDASRLHLGRVRIGDGMRVAGDGDATGVAVLLWEILSGRPAEGGDLPRVHEVVDEIHPDIDDVVANALSGEIDSVEALVEDLERAAEGKVDSREDAIETLRERALAKSKATAFPAPPPIKAKPKPDAPSAKKESVRAQAKPAAEAPESVVEAPKSVREAPKSVVEAPKTVVEAPESVVEAPESVVEAPKSVVEAPKSVVEAPETVAAVTVPAEAVPASTDAVAAPFEGKPKQARGKSIAPGAMGANPKAGKGLRSSTRPPPAKPAEGAKPKRANTRPPPKAPTVAQSKPNTKLFSVKAPAVPNLEDGLDDWDDEPTRIAWAAKAIEKTVEKPSEKPIAKAAPPRAAPPAPKAPAAAAPQDGAADDWDLEPPRIEASRSPAKRPSKEPLPKLDDGLSDDWDVEPTLIAAPGAAKREVSSAPPVAVEESGVLPKMFVDNDDAELGPDEWDEPTVRKMINQAFLEEIINARRARGIGPSTPPPAEATATGAMPSVLLFLGKNEKPLIDALRNAGYQIDIGKGPRDVHAAKSGLRCVVIDVEAYPNARELIEPIRSGPMRAVPMVVLAPANTKKILEAFLVAADACIAKPCRPEEVVAQIGALVRMSRRIERAQAANAKAFTGDLAHVSLSTVLTIVGLERRTGVFEVSPPDSARTSIDIVAGAVTGGKIAGTRAAAVDALRAMMQAQRGRFTFRVLPDIEPPNGATPLREMLLDVARAIDEAGRDESEQAHPSSPRK